MSQWYDLFHSGCNDRQSAALDTCGEKETPRRWLRVAKAKTAQTTRNQTQQKKQPMYAQHQ